MRVKRITQWGISFLIVLAVSCSPSTYISNKVGETFKYAGLSYQSENDPILVREAFPFNLKTLDILLASDPENATLLSTASGAYAMYAYAFILEDAERISVEDYTEGKKHYKRALNLFQRSKEYGIRSMEVAYPKFRDMLETRLSPEETSFTESDVETMYWLAASIAGMISAGSGKPEYLIDLPKVGWLFDNALHVNPDWNNGALYTAMISYSMSRPDADSNAEQIARSYYSKAISLSSGNDCSPYLRLAESVSVTNQDREEFIELLNKTLAVDVDANPGIRLANILAQDRATWLLTQTEELFY